MDPADSFLQMTLMGGLTEVVGVIGRFGEEVVILEFWVVGTFEELVRDLEVVIFEELVEALMLLLATEDLELDVDLLDICVFVCCCSCCRHFALRFLNQTC